MIHITAIPSTKKTASLLGAKLSLVPEEGEVNWTGGRLEGALNGDAVSDKLFQIEVLKAADVLVPDFCPAGTTFPTIAPTPGWLPRRRFHRKGRDFTSPPPKPIYFVEPLLLSEEWRLHIFRRRGGSYVSIRAAKKVPIEGKETHPWVRSHETGWKFSYGQSSSEPLRVAAKSAIKALGLDFGAVDLGLFCGQPVVLEVNTCPSLEATGTTLNRYVDEIRKHFR